MRSPRRRRIGFPPIPPRCWRRCRLGRRTQGLQDGGRIRQEASGGRSHQPPGAPTHDCAADRSRPQADARQAGRSRWKALADANDGSAPPPSADLRINQGLVGLRGGFDPQAEPRLREGVAWRAARAPGWFAPPCRMRWRRRRDSPWRRRSPKNSRPSCERRRRGRTSVAIAACSPRTMSVPIRKRQANSSGSSAPGSGAPRASNCRWRNSTPWRTPFFARSFSTCFAISRQPAVGAIRVSASALLRNRRAHPNDATGCIRQRSWRSTPCAPCCDRKGPSRARPH